MIKKVAHVVFPALSVTINKYIPFPVMHVQLIYASPLSVALTQEKLSLKEMVTQVVYTAHVLAQVNVGSVLSIRVTEAIADQVLPATSLNWNMKVPFHVSVCQLSHPLLVIITGSLVPVRVAMTFPLV